MTKDEALKLGLQLIEAAESLALDSAICGNYVKEERELIQRSKIAFEEALAQPEQKAVPWATREDYYRELNRSVEHIRKEMEIKSVTMRCKDYDLALPIINTHFGRVLVGQVFASPQRKPLTEREILDLLPDAQHGWTTAFYGKWVARAVERAHGIKEK